MKPLPCLLPRKENTLTGSGALAEKGSGAPQIGKKLSEQNLDQPITTAGFVLPVRLTVLQTQVASKYIDSSLLLLRCANNTPAT